ncbi:class I SAM-dependent methyltransferase [Sphaerisporangium viridialbum]|uniref:class I SAM-dependent methyltransferase n=1 Tax=Sphaerisporangium viridialbum TaxID=46189 RepID=UPI003C794B7B
MPAPTSAPERMYWTPHASEGAGAEVLGDLGGTTVVELGCGAGHHLAHLVAYHGARGTGIDIAGGQIERARARYAHLPGVTFTAGDALDFLAETETRFDVCYSVFGAVGLTPPDLLLPAISHTLRPGGVLAFSVPHPDRRGRLTRDTLVLPFGNRLPIQRWEPAVSAWPALLAKDGLRINDLHEVPSASAGPLSLIITARRL